MLCNNTFKTNNVDDLKSSLSILSYSGSSNLNGMFFNSPLSITKIFMVRYSSLYHYQRLYLSRSHINSHNYIYFALTLSI